MSSASSTSLNVDGIGMVRDGDRWQQCGQRSGVMENTGVYSYRPPGSTEVQTAQITNELEGTWRYVAVAPLVRYRFLPTSQRSWLTLATGLQLGFPLQATYVQRQRFDPANTLVFIVDGRRVKERTLVQGSVQSRRSVVLHHIIELEHQWQLGTGYCHRHQWNCQQCRRHRRCPSQLLQSLWRVWI